jgi:hypothetical protein
VDQWIPTAGEVAGDDAPVPEIPTTLQPDPQQHPLQPSEEHVVLDDSPCAEVGEDHDKSQPAVEPHDSDPGRKELIGVISILLLVIIGLLIFMAGGASPQQTAANPVVSPPEESEAAANELRGENEAMRVQLAEMAAQAKQLRDQLETLSDARDKAVSDLGRANSSSDKELTGLRAEIARLESVVSNSKPTPESSSTVREPLPEPQVVGTVYKVSGLRPGDTLNVRSGPGSGFSVVTQLHLGVRVTAAGSAVANGDDWWFPCHLSGKIVDPATGTSKPWTAKGWINSAFLEEDG